MKKKEKRVPTEKSFPYRLLGQLVFFAFSSTFAFAQGNNTLGIPYRYTQGTNRLEALQTTGNITIHLGYDPNGNLVSDNSKRIQVTQMGRNDLPVQMTINAATTVNYRYGSGGRIYKKVASPTGTTVEYYLRDASGAPVAVHNESDSTWTFQIYGLDLIAEMGLVQGEGSQERDSAVAPTKTPTNEPAPVQPPRGPKIIRDILLGFALAAQQNLLTPHGNEPRPKPV